MATIQQQLENDLDAIFNGGLQIIVTHIYGSDQEQLRAFYDPEYSKLFEGSGQAAVESVRPSILIRTSQAENIDHNSSFVINSITYYPLEIESDNHGLKRIYISTDQVN